MKRPLDTHLLSWGASGEGLSAKAVQLIDDPGNELLFSAASIGEVAIKTSLGRADFQLVPGVFRRELLESGYEELAVTGARAAGVSTLPDLHKDPFDRLLIAQAIVEGITLLSADQAVLAYPRPIAPAI